MRKILKNYNKSKRIHGVTKGKVGTRLGIMDKYGNGIAVGDEVKYFGYRGIVLYNRHYDQYGIALIYSLRNADDKYNVDSYGKFLHIPMDNGARMEIELIRDID